MDAQAPRHIAGPGVQDDDAEVRRSVESATGILMGPTAQYLGLTVVEAMALAAAEGRELRVSEDSGFYVRRASLQPLRVNVLIDTRGRVVVADAG